LSTLFFGRALTGVFSTIHIGNGPDCALLMWDLVWWPHALSHRVNPFFTDLMWPPFGYNVAWSVGIPFPSLATWPITSALGPVSAFNILALLFPALAAWTAFLLCRYLVREYWIALVGGYIYGFSSYVLGQQVLGHIHVTAIFAVPLFLYVTLMYLNEEIARAKYIALMSILLIVQFLTTTEFFATSLFFGAIALVLAMLLMPEARPRLLDVVKSLAVSAAIALVVLSPYLYYIVAAGAFGSPFWRPIGFSVDLANSVIPGSTLLLGQILGLGSVDTRMLAGNPEIQGGYIGIPLLAIAVAFGYSRRRDPIVKLIIAMMAIAYVLALGPRLHFAGRTFFGMPWKLVEHIPLLNNALPERFAAFLFLGFAIVAAMWLSTASISGSEKLAVASAVIVFMLPNFSSSYWTSTWTVPAFFTSGDYSKYLAPHEIVIPLPYAGNGQDVLWQASTDMYFRIAGGRVPKSLEYKSWPITTAFANETSIPAQGEQLKAFMAAHGVTAVVLADDARDHSIWQAALAGVDEHPVQVGGVTVYHVPPAILESYRGLSAAEMEARMDEARFETLLIAANRYVMNHDDLKALTPREAMKLGFLPADWVDPTDNKVSAHSGLWLGPVGGGQVGVGVVGSYNSVKRIIEKYSPYATRVYFPYPRTLNGTPTGDTFMRKLVLTFDAAGLSRAAAKSDSAVSSK